MLPVFKIDHSSLAILLGEAKNSKSFAKTAWGMSSYEALCETIYMLFKSSSGRINVELIKEEINKFRIVNGKKFDNFALDYVLENIQEYASVDY